MSAPFKWNPAEVNRLIALWKTGASASTIAGEFGCGLTRNAILGKIDRLRREGVDLGPKRQGGARKATRRQAKAPVLRQRVKPASKSAMLPTQMNPTTLLDLGPRQCRFPIDDINTPGTAETLFCGAHQRDGSSYCEHHHARCMTPYKRAKKPRDRSGFIARDKFVFGVAA